MAFLQKRKKGYYLVESYRDNGKVTSTQTYIGPRPPWPKEKGWTGLTDNQIELLRKRADNKKANKLLPKVQPPTGRYRTVVLDVPWPLKKIVREVRPNQTDLLDYPVMSISQIEQIADPRKVAFMDGCHVYLWCTHKYLPVAFELFKRWGVKYECLLTWVKNVGPTPFSYMYNTEHCLFGRIGSLPLVKMGKPTYFVAKTTGHSRKPLKFYNLVKMVSPEPRLDMFSREHHKGFVSWGNEVGKFG